ncbi:hypothetical protein VTK73DRAFT_8827 [Phialemonium thermophilum]|uniref:Uncharacterized protein n=1 Tax=Phialemonium thermophilum TaxID=223376 RepID=A0ABR3W5X2_9PEZI
MVFSFVQKNGAKWRNPWQTSLHVPRHRTLTPQLEHCSRTRRSYLLSLGVYDFDLTPRYKRRGSPRPRAKRGPRCGQEKPCPPSHPLRSYWRVNTLVSMYPGPGVGRNLNLLSASTLLL